MYYLTLFNIYLCRETLPRQLQRNNNTQTLSLSFFVCVLACLPSVTLHSSNTWRRLLLSLTLSLSKAFFLCPSLHEKFSELVIFECQSNFLWPPQLYTRHENTSRPLCLSSLSKAILTTCDIWLEFWTLK